MSGVEPKPKMSVSMDNPADLRRKRAGRKMIITKKINEIKSIISRGQNLQILSHFEEQLNAAVLEAENAHMRYIENLDDSDMEKNDEWIAEVQNTADNCICEIRHCLDENEHSSLASANTHKKNSSPKKETNRVEEWCNKIQPNKNEKYEVDFWWEGHAKEVVLAGSFDNWEGRTFLNPTTTGFHKKLYLQQNCCEYKYIVDGEWRCDPRSKKVSDGLGGFNNIHYQNEKLVDNGDQSYGKNSNQEQSLWGQLKRVSIPTFSGNVREYENWRAIFVACIDNADVPDEYKLLQLRQYLTGDALKVIDGLGHSKSAFSVAKERLERKFGGARRSTALYLEEVDQFRPIRANQADDIEKFADLLDVLVIKFKDSRKENELGSGLLYIKLQQKLSVPMLAQYYKSLHDNKEDETVLLLMKWVLLES